MTDREAIEKLSSIMRAFVGDCWMHCGLPTYLREVIQQRLDEVGRRQRRRLDVPRKVQSQFKRRAI